MKSLSAISAACIALLLTVAFSAQAQTLYRYTDESGRVVYTDRPPSPTDKAKDVQMKKAGGNFIETDKMSATTRYAVSRYPVTLYAFPCGDACESGETLLQRRGIPYTYVDTQSESGNEKLKALTGKTTVPVLQVGDTFLVGFNEGTWNSKLDSGGYGQDAGVRTSIMHTKTATPAEPEVQRSADEAAAEEPVEEATPPAQ